LNNKNKKILSIVGARPQFIKLFPLSKALREHYEEIIVHTGQHFDKEMSDLFFHELEIPEPNLNLNINKGNHGEQTGKMLIELEKVMLEEKPDLVIVFGDTNTTLAGALNAAKLHIPALHIEAGLRSFNRSMPEEINRVMSDHAADYLFAPTKTAMENLHNEGLENKAFLTGDIMVDSLKAILEKARKKDTLTKLKLPHSYYLMTLHRPYNVDDPVRLQLIFDKLAGLDKPVVFPAHPRTRNIIEQNNINIPKTIQLIKPQGYLDFINLQTHCEKILTDSGGIQKEAYIQKKPCLTIRPETEWTETVEDGWNLLVNPENEEFAEKIEKFHPTQEQSEIFGTNVTERMMGVISERIVKD
jgi:UDP-N-acetylglucosamine 2-epimerase